jgi:hypothetical protein
MALISLKARAGIAALTFAAALAPFVSATPAKATLVSFFDATDTVSVTVFPISAQVTLIPGSGEFLQVIVRSANQDPTTIKEATGGIRFFDTEGFSDILQAKIIEDDSGPGRFLDQILKLSLALALVTKPWQSCIDYRCDNAELEITEIVSAAHALEKIEK